MLVGTLIYGFVNSFVLALVALGFNLTFGVSGISNFAYGALYILAGYTCWLLLNPLGLPHLLAVVLSVVITAAVGALIYRLVLQRVRGMVLSEVIATFGIGLAILEFFRYLGFIGFEYTLPVFLDAGVELFGVVVDAQRIAIVIVGGVLVGGLWLFIHHTRTGLAFRGIAQDEQTALTLGIDTDRVGTLAMACGAGLAALAAITILPLGTIDVDQGYEVLLNALAVCIVGGMGSTGGAFMAAFLIGYTQTFTATYVGNHWVMVVPLLAILIVLAVRPSGLMGQQKQLEERI